MINEEELKYVLTGLVHNGSFYNNASDPWRKGMLEAVDKAITEKLDSAKESMDDQLVKDAQGRTWRQCSQGHPLILYSGYVCYCCEQILENEDQLLRTKKAMLSCWKEVFGERMQ